MRRNLVNLVACLLLVSVAPFVQAQDSSNVCIASNPASRPCVAHMLDMYLKSLLSCRP
jgi:hypothetical protein